jgi:porin
MLFHVSLFPVRDTGGNQEGQGRELHMETDHNWPRQFGDNAAVKTLVDSLKRIAAPLIGTLLLAPAGAIGAEKPAEEQQTLPDERGFALGLVYRADVLSNVSGGLKQGTTALGNLDVKLDFDLDKLIGWDGVSVGLHGIASHGGKPNANLVGSSQGVDNIEVDTNAAKLFQAWIQKQFLNEKLSALFGLYDLNSEFYVSHSAGIFLHPSPGIGSEFAQTGLNGPSVFPTSSVGLRVGYLPTPETYVQAVVLDGVPGDPDNPRGTHIQFNDGDGALRVVEVGYSPGKAQGGESASPGQVDKYAVGAWSYTSRFADLVDVDEVGDPLMRKGNKGFYVLAERTLYRGTRNPDSHTDGFIRYGRANADFNQFSSYFQTGLVFSGMVAGRSEDQFAVSYGTARTGDKHRRAASIAGAEATSHESVWEATYRAHVAPWLSVQPNIQYVINPGADAQIKNSTVLGVRFEMSGEK